MVAYYSSVTESFNKGYKAMSVPSPCGPNVTQGAEAWMASPPSVTRSYEPSSVINYKYDPTKGRPFKKLSKDGSILMSSYSIGTVSQQDNVVSRLRHFKGRNTFSVICGPTCHSLTWIDLESKWTENFDISRLSTTSTYVDSGFDDSDITNAIALTQQEAYAKALSGYDALTELGELKETLGFLSGKISSFVDLATKIRDKDSSSWHRGRTMKPKDLVRSADKGLRQLGSRWMEYRYAIMPLIYSMKDISRILAEGSESYKTSRSREILAPESSFDPIARPLIHISKQTTGNIEVASTVKQLYKSEGALNIYQRSISTNPFKTAWELIPLSFVVDWFINVGDVITSFSSYNFSDQTVCCTSIRKEYEETYFYVDKSSDVINQSYSGNACRSAFTFNWNYTRSNYDVLRVVKYHTYERFLFQKPSPKIVWNPNLNWKRIIDGFVLIYQPTSQRLRSLK